MRIFLCEGWYSGSHKAWADGFTRHSSHKVHVLGMEGIHWRWRMQGGCVTLADMIASTAAEFGPPDVVLVSATVDAARRGRPPRPPTPGRVDRVRDPRCP